MTCSVHRGTLQPAPPRPHRTDAWCKVSVSGRWPLWNTLGGPETYGVGLFSHLGKEPCCCGRDIAHVEGITRELLGLTRLFSFALGSDV